MSIWRGSRPPVPARAVDTVDMNGFARMINGASAGSANVNGGTIENAEQSVAIAGAVDLIASLVSELPVDQYSGIGSSRRQMPLSSWLEDPSGDGYGNEDWRYRGLYSLLYRGNAYGDIMGRGRQDGTGFVTQMDWWHPDRVSGAIVDGRVQWTAGGKQIPDSRMYHRRAYATPGQIEGQSPIARAATQVGISLAATRFGKGWFDSDANPTGILRNTLGSTDAEKSKTVKDRFMAALRGTREPIVMGRGWEWQTISTTPEESQFLETMGWTEAQCARIYGPGLAEIMGYQTGDGQTYANVQDRDITLLKYAVGKWIRRMERIMSDMLPKPQYVIFNRDALLETNTLQRYQAYALASGNAPWETVDEIRELENLKPLPEPDPTPAPEPPADDPAADDDQPIKEGQ